MDRPRVMCVVGTRPDAIKSAPVVLELQKFKRQVETVLVSTGQHREMLAQALQTFGLKADHDLSIMRHGQTLSDITSRAMEGLDRLLDSVAPEFVMAQGDTTTTFCASLAAFYRRIPFGHIEAGLRTETIDSPFPEEFNRRATGLIATHHFAPTKWASENLLREGMKPERIYVTGNTGIDAVLHAAKTEGKGWFEGDSSRVILLTTHRRENWGEPQRHIACAARRLVEEFPNTLLVVPMHKNPQVRDLLKRELGECQRARLIEPPEYGRFVKLMKRSYLILTDSGGIQEEAPAFGVPVLVLRESTERPEGIEAGTAKLVGTDEDAIGKQARRILSDPQAHAKMAHAVSPYGDGKAASRIRHVVLNHLGIDSPEVPAWT